MADNSAEGWLAADLCHPRGDISLVLCCTFRRSVLPVGVVSAGRGIAAVDDHVLDDPASGPAKGGRLLVFR